MKQRDSQFTLVVLPGWGGDKESWADFVVEMEKHDIQTQVLELPCFGGVSCPKSVWGVEDYAEYVLTRIEEIEGDLVLLGHSFGGQVAVKALSLGNDRIKKVILSGPAVIRPRRLVRRGVFWIIAKTGKIIFSIPGLKKFQSIARKILYKGADSPDYTQTDDIKREIFKKVIRQDVSQHLSEIDIPVLVIAGDADTYVPLKHSKKIAAELKNVQLKVIPKGRHGLHKQYLDIFVRSITDFLYKK